MDLTTTPSSSKKSDIFDDLFSSHPISTSQTRPISSMPQQGSTRPTSTSSQPPQSQGSRSSTGAPLSNDNLLDTFYGSQPNPSSRSGQSQKQRNSSNDDPFDLLTGPSKTTRK